MKTKPAPSTHFATPHTASISKSTLAKLLATACLALAITEPAAAADDEITLKFGGFLPKTHYGVVHGTQVFMDEVAARTKGKVKFQYFPGQQAGKLDQLMNLANAGVVDLVEIIPGLLSQKMPLVGVIELPGLVTESCAGSAAMRAVGSPGGPIYQSDFAPNGVRILGFEVLPPYQVISRKPVNAPADMSGMKIRPAGAAMEVSMTKVGAVPVLMSGAELYDSLSKGTIDGVMFTFLAARDYSLTDVTKYSAYGYPWGSGALLIAMPEKKFQSLPKDIQNALVEAGKVSDKRLCSYMQETEATATKEAQAAGVQIHWWTEQQKKSLGETLSSVTTNWVKDLDARGKPASRTVEEFRKALNAK